MDFLGLYKVEESEGYPKGQRSGGDHDRIESLDPPHLHVPCLISSQEPLLFPLPSYALQNVQGKCAGASTTVIARQASGVKVLLLPTPPQGYIDKLQQQQPNSSTSRLAADRESSRGAYPTNLTSEWGKKNFKFNPSLRLEKVHGASTSCTVMN